MLGLLCAMVLVACQSLGGEPPIIATIPPPTPTTEATDAPTSTPAVIAMQSAQSGQESSGRVVGQVVNQSADAGIPAELTVTLVIITTENERIVHETMADEEGAFVFEDVPFVGGYLYFTVVEYDDVPYISETSSAAPSMSQLDLSITVFETTSDRDSVVITSMLSQVNAVGDFLEFADTISLVNLTDRTLLTDLRGGTQNRRASLAFDLPPGAVFIGAAGDSAAFYDEAVYRVYLTTPLYAGQNAQITLQYIVPYQNSAIIEFPAAYALNGAVGLLVENRQLNITADWIRTNEPRDIGGQTFNLFGGPLSLAAGDLIRYEVRGASASVGSSSQSGVITSDTLLPLILILAVVLIVVVMGIVSMQSRASIGRNKDAVINSLLRQIQQLEAQHDSGQLNHDVYQRHKATLTEQLARLRDGDE